MAYTSTSPIDAGSVDELFPTCPPPLVLQRLATGSTVPVVPVSRWLNSLAAPQAHPNARNDYGRRAEQLVDILRDRGVEALVDWAWHCWQGNLPALAGVLATAPVLQAAARAGWVDAEWASGLVEESVADARNLTNRRHRSGHRRRSSRLLYGIDLDTLAATDPRPEDTEAADWAERVTSWVCDVSVVGLPSTKPALVLEANLPAFWAWYVRRVPMDDISQRKFPPPPLARQLGTGQRLEDHLAGEWHGGARRRDLSPIGRMLLGPRRYNGWPIDRGWRLGIGYWSLIALDAFSQDRRPPAPPDTTVHWWVNGFRSLGAAPAPWESVVEPSRSLTVA